MLRTSIAGRESRLWRSDIAQRSRIWESIEGGGQLLAGVYFVPCCPGRGHTGDEEDRGRVDDGGKITPRPLPYTSECLVSVETL